MIIGGRVEISLLKSKVIEQTNYVLIFQQYGEQRLDTDGSWLCKSLANI